jgi:NAD(P)-dependent dehydrogenase (short-subunit alcohol dehydrogenase family)
VGIEGFIEATAKDVTPSGIGVTIVEPGGARTQFRYGSLRLAEPMQAYDDSPASMVRALRELPQPPIGDPAKMAAIIIASFSQTPAPLRLVLGSDAYGFIHTALSERLAALEAQRDVALSTDFPAGT